jgi:hypothetical protein
MTPFKIIRIFILLIILATVAFYTKTQKLKSRNWSQTLEVVIYPINGENSPIVEEYINNLDDSVFAPVDEFINQESRNYSISMHQPTKTRLGPIIHTLPPQAPLPSAGIVTIAWWSIKFRYWTYKNTPDDISNHHRIRTFVLYYEVDEGRRLKHSLGLDKGLLTVVHAFASEDMDAQNNIVITHELLHTVGATDKYGANGQPVYPDGYAFPEQKPLYPQTKAEIMAVHLSLSADSSRMAESLDECAIGVTTATEINWLKQ